MTASSWGSAFAVAMLSACGGGFALTGQVDGLAGTGLVLSDGQHTLAIDQNGPFTFAASLAQGTAYRVTLQQEPSRPRQTCTVQNGSGTIKAQAPEPVAVQWRALTVLRRGYHGPAPTSRPPRGRTSRGA